MPLFCILGDDYIKKTKRFPLQFTLPMKIKSLLAFACLFAFSSFSAIAKSSDNDNPQQNAIVTSRYYQKLIDAPAPKLAELEMFTNMLPKGGDLHHHYDGSLYAENYLDWVAQGGYCIYRESDAALKAEKYRVEMKPAALSEAARRLCLGAEAVRQDGLFNQELLQRWSIKDYGNHFHGQIAPDQHFFSTFSYFIQLANYSYQAGLHLLKQRALAENVQYLETIFAMAPVVENPLLGGKINALNAASTDSQIDEALSAFADFIASDPQAQTAVRRYVQTADEAAAGVDDERFKIRFHAFVFRGTAPAEVFSGMVSAFAAAQASGRIVGVNIVGAENGHVAMRDYTLHMKMYRFLKRRFPDVKLSLHAGELALGMVPPEGLQNHIRDALLIAGADRIGHGADIAHEVDAFALLRLMRQRRIPVEINLSSNAFILGLQGDAHPVRIYREHRVPFVIASDDTGVSRNSLSHEYLLYASRYRPTYAELKATVYDTIRHSFLSVQEKRGELAQLDRRFAVFEQKIAEWARLARRKRR